MDKVKLPKGIFDFIQSERYFDTNEENYWKERVLLTILTHEFSLEGVKFETVLQALATDYEVEETPEDKVREYYKENANRDTSDTYSTAHKLGTRDGILGTLSLLNIKIVGVNHE